MEKLELPAKATVKEFGGIREMARKVGRAPSTIFSRVCSESGYFPHWWTADLTAIAEREGIKLPKPRKRRAAA